jgi:hypothetical protein
MVIVVNDGLEYLAKYCNQSSVGKFGWLALDGGTTVEAAGTTALTTEITTDGGARMVADTLGYEASYKATWVGLFSFTGALAIKGCGCFNSLTPSGSKMLMCHAFAATKNVDDGESMQLTMKLAFSTV